MRDMLRKMPAPGPPETSTGFRIQRGKRRLVYGTVLGKKAAVLTAAGVLAAMVCGQDAAGSIDTDAVCSDSLVMRDITLGVANFFTRG